MWSLVHRSRLAVPAAVSIALLLSGCAVQTQADGSSRVNVSLGEALGITKPAAPAGQAGAPAPAAAPAAAVTAGGEKAVFTAAQTAAVQRILSCTASKKDWKQWDKIQAAMGKSGWTFDNAGTPLQLAKPLTVYGLKATMVSFHLDGHLHSYKSHFPGVSSAELIKKARLKPAKENKDIYTRWIKQGKLEAAAEAGVTVLACEIDVEG